MEPITIALVLIALALAALSIWLFVSRGTAMAALAAQAAVTARLEADIASARLETATTREQSKGREEDLTSRIDELMAEIVSVSEQRATLETELKNARERHEQDNASVRRETESKLESAKESFRSQLRGEQEKLEAERRVLKDELLRMETRIKSLNEETRAAFTTAAQQVVANTNAEFLKLADAKMQAQQAAAAADMDKRQAAVEVLVKPIGESLKKTEEKLGEIERDRAESFGKLSEQIRGVTESNSALRDQTGKLVGALKRPEIRGRYGEIQLERLVELAGMTAYADFNTQHSTRDSAGNLLRPDLIVTMSNRREIVVDAKTNISAYLDAIDAPDAEKREECFQKFAGHVEQQIISLARKQYWSQYKGSPEFVVMFIPGDQFLDAALRRKPSLIEAAIESGVILATPSSFIGLLKTVALGWREKRLEDQARELFKIGSELHDRAATAWDHLSDVGGGLHRTVEAYNKAVRSIETRLMPTLRKFEDAGAKSAKELPEIPEVSVRPQNSASPRPPMPALPASTDDLFVSPS